MCVNLIAFLLTLIWDQPRWVNKSFVLWIHGQEKKNCSKDGGGVCRREKQRQWIFQVHLTSKAKAVIEQGGVATKEVSQ